VDKKVPVGWSGREYDTAFSPDDGAVIFVSEQAKKDIFNLYGYDMQRKQEVTLIRSERVSIRYPAWAKPLDAVSAATVPTPSGPAAVSTDPAPNQKEGPPPAAPTGYVPPYLRNE
jgi:hypothetical protein